MRKNRIVNILKNKFVAGVFVLALVVFGMALFTDTYEVQATGMTENTVAFKSESLEVSKYFDEKGNRIAPKPTEGGYADWIFAGWYKEADCINAVNSKSGKRWAKFVPSEVLSVKCQTTAESDNDPTSSLRLISTVDSLRYSKVGFEVSYEFGAQGLNIDTTNVYKRIESAFEGQEYGFSPNIFDLQSQYFVTATLTNINADNYGAGFFIKPYWVTLDGTKVYGVSRYARVEDSYLGIANVPVRLYSNETVAGGEVVVDYSTLKSRDKQKDAFALYSVDGNASYDVGDIFSSVTISDDTANKKVTCTLPNDIDATKADGMLVNLRFRKSVENTELPKVNTFGVTTSLTGEDGASKNVLTSNSVYHYYHTEYTGEADKDWYDANKTEFVITSPDELYGLAELVNNKTFKSQKVYLSSDIIVNKDTIDATKENWSEGLIPWTPIGNIGSNAFAGQFYGQGHTISGLSYKKTDATAEYLGLFGITSVNSNISDLSLTNSCFEYTGSNAGVYMGSFVAWAEEGVYRNLYSKATLIHSQKGVGGILGLTNAPVTISNCWFDGSITSTSTAGYRRAGGILGWANGDTTIEHCLNTGSVHSNTSSGHAAVGGILGVAGYGNPDVLTQLTKPTVHISDCLNVGEVTTGGVISRMGTLVGSIASQEVTIEHSYATYESCGMPDLAANNTYSPVLYQGAVNPKISYIGIINDENLFGFAGKQNTTLDFTNYWTIAEGKIPMLKSLAKQDALYIPDSEWEGKGTEESPWIIKTSEELYGLADSVNAGEPYQGKYFVLGADIKVNSGSASAWEKTPAKYNWIPIGKTGSPAFAGHFNGQGHTISGLYYKKADAATLYIGLFGKTTADSSVQNVYIKNSRFEYTGSKEGVYMGSAAGFGGGTFDTIYSDAILKHNIYGAGGIVGATDMNLTISNCWYNGKLTSTRAGEARAGGILGYITAGVNRISHCLNSGEIHSDTTSGVARLGGIVGYFNSKNPDMIIDDCLNTGKITTNGSISQMATIAGMCNTGKITNSYATEESCGMDALFDYGQQTLYQGTATATNVNMLEDLKGENGYLLTTLDFEAHWYAHKQSTPVLQCFTDVNDANVIDTNAWFKAHSGTVDDPYVLSSKIDLYSFAKKVNNGNPFQGQYVELGADIGVNALPEGKTIDYWATEPPTISWTPIGNGTHPFAGTFNGNEKVISGLYYKNADAAVTYGGLFGKTTTSSNINQLSVKNSYFEYSGSAAGSYVGSVVGYAGGTIDTVYSNAYVKHSQYGGGGIAGYTDTVLNLSNCFFDGSLTLTRNAASNNRICSGGILGYANTANADVEMSHCLNDGEIINTGKGFQIGGLVGCVEKGTVRVTDCLNTGEVNGNGIINQVTTLFGGGADKGTLYLDKSYATYESLTEIQKFNATQLAALNHLYQNSKGGFVENIEMLSTTGVNDYDDIKGENAYLNTLLDFEHYWTAVDGSTPMLTAFVTDETEVDVSTLDRVAGVSTMWSKVATGTEQDPYVLKDAADLYGLASLVNATNGNDFANKYFVLANDIVINASNRDTWSQTSPINSWIPIGTSGKQFAGKINGQGNAISGVYQAKSANSGAYMGLFQYTAEGCVIENLSIENSMYTFTGSGDYARMGSFVAWANGGTFRNLYSDTLLNNNDRFTGGIIGLTNGEVTISGCWFGGKINATGTMNYQGVGGILGWAAGGPVTIEHCLNSGKIHANISTSHAGVGGLLGIAGSIFNTTGSTAGPKVTMDDCLNVGTVTTASVISRLGTLIGSVVSKQVSITNSFATKESCGMPTLSAFTDDQPLYQGSVKLESKENVQRLDSKSDANTKMNTAFWTQRDNTYPLPTVFITNGQ